MAPSLDNTILITGATGFLGKVLLEELVRRRKQLDLAKIILLVRPKGAPGAHDRFMNHIAPSRCFSLLPQDWKQLVTVIDGDLVLDKCGICTDDYRFVCENVTHIIHTAACIKFDSEVSEAVSSNIVSTLNILSLAQECSRLKQLVHTSTAYVVPPTTGPIYETLHPLPRPAARLYGDLKNGRLQKGQAVDITGHPNIYSLSKCLAEHLLIERRGSVPLTIVRPSIICAAWKRPFPGWIDSRAAFAGLAIGYGNGLLRVVDGLPEAKLDIVPVDEVASCLIREAFRLSRIPTPPRVVFSVATVSRAFPLGEACRQLAAFFEQRPRVARAPALRYIGPRSVLFHMYEIMYHRMPLIFSALLLRATGRVQKAAEVEKAYRLVTAMNAVFAPYTCHTYDFRPTHNEASFENSQYMEVICEGVWANLMKAKL